MPSRVRVFQDSWLRRPRHQEVGGWFVAQAEERDLLLLAANANPDGEYGPAYAYNWRDDFFIELAERGLVPDFFIRAGIRGLCRKRLRQCLSEDCEANAELAEKYLEESDASPMAVMTEKANEQHYEVPAPTMSTSAFVAFL